MKGYRKDANYPQKCTELGHYGPYVQPNLAHSQVLFSCQCGKHYVPGWPKIELSLWERFRNWLKNLSEEN